MNEIIKRKKGKRGKGENSDPIKRDPNVYLSFFFRYCPCVRRCRPDIDYALCFPFLYSRSYVHCFPSNYFARQHHFVSELSRVSSSKPEQALIYINTGKNCTKNVLRYSKQQIIVLYNELYEHVCLSEKAESNTPIV